MTNNKKKLREAFKFSIQNTILYSLITIVYTILIFPAITHSWAWSMIYKPPNTFPNPIQQPNDH